MTLSAVGKSAPRKDLREKITGQARFSADLKMPGMLYGRILRSPHPHARIKSIDASRALALPGVQAVVTSEDERFSEGDAVLVNGCGLSETRDGGYAEYARVNGDSIVPIPDGLDAAQAMQIGTAGYTAALAIHRMEQNGQSPDAGRVVVTGATGGVGSVALDMLSGRGYEAVAVTGKSEQRDYLKRIGASEILLRDDIDLGKRPLEKAQWAGAIDNLGGDYLTWLTRTVDYGGNIASIGLAASHELNTTVIPFILRAVCLLGINSVDTPRDLRLQVWERIGKDLKPRHLDVIGSRTIGFDDLPDAFQAYIDGTVTGRVVVEIGS